MDFMGLSYTLYMRAQSDKYYDFPGFFFFFFFQRYNF